MVGNFGISFLTGLLATIASVLAAFGIGLLMFLLMPVLAIAGIIVCGIGLGQNKKAKGVQKQLYKIFNIIGLVFNIIGLVFSILTLITEILFIIVFVVIPVVLSLLPIVLGLLLAPIIIPLAIIGVIIYVVMIVLSGATEIAAMGALLLL